MRVSRQYHFGEVRARKFLLKPLRLRHDMLASKEAAETKRGDWYYLSVCATRRRLAGNKARGVVPVGSWLSKLGHTQ